MSTNEFEPSSHQADETLERRDFLYVADPLSNGHRLRVPTIIDILARLVRRSKDGREQTGEVQLHHLTEPVEAGQSHDIQTIALPPLESLVLGRSLSYNSVFPK